MWVVVNIGCIECGVSSGIVGVWSDKAEAERIAEACQHKYHWRESGQNRFEVFELPEAGTLSADYQLETIDFVAGKV
jgi:hypothetical protein